MSDLAQNEALRMVLSERDKQDRKWGVQNHDVPIWMEILGEEFGEVARADLEFTFGNGSRSQVLTEMVQVAAVALAMVECELRNGRSYLTKDGDPCASSL